MVGSLQGEAKALSHFDYAGPMTEAVLLGNVALRAGHAIDWDAHGMRVTNDPHANQWIRKAYRKGWNSQCSLSSPKETSGRTGKIEASLSGLTEPSDI